MLFTGKINSEWDEESLGVDSSSLSDQFRIELDTFVQGVFPAPHTNDYYLLDIPAGDYTLYVTTEGVNATVRANSFYQTQIVNSSGAVVWREDATSPDPMTDQVTFTHSGEGDLYLKIIGHGTFTYRAAVYSQEPDVPAPPPTDQWRLIATDGYFASIGGNGEVFGTSAFQAVFVADIAGSVSLDPSFNRGGDIVFLTGDAADWSIRQLGTAVVLHDGDTYVQVPVGTAGIVLDFDDGSRLLKIDTGEGAIKIGAQAVEDDYASISAAAQTLSLPPGYDEDAVGRLIMAENGSAMAGSNLEIFGTAGDEEIILLADSVVSLDPSFNRGGDTLAITGDSTDFQASLVGSSVLIEGDRHSVLIPVGANGMTIAFLDDVHATLRYDTQLGSVFIGDQVIGEMPAPLTFA